MTVYQRRPVGQQPGLAIALPGGDDGQVGERRPQLARLGAEVVAADVHDVESLKRAFAGATGVFCVTFFWAHMSPEKEYAEAEAMAKAAKAAVITL